MDILSSVKKIAFCNGSFEGKVQKNIYGFDAIGNDAFFVFDNGDYRFMEYAGGAYAVPYNWSQMYDTIIKYNSGFDATIYTEADIMFDQTFLYGWVHHTVKKSATHQSAVDYCPGTYSDIISNFNDLIWSYADVSTSFEKPTFIPTVSALDIKSTEYLFDVSAHSPVESITAFDKVYSPAFDDNYFSEDIFESLTQSNLTDMFDYIYNESATNSCEQSDVYLGSDTLHTGSFFSKNASNKVVISDYVVDSSATCILHAANSIVINPNTVFKPGSVVELGIVPCSHGQCEPPSFKTNSTEVNGFSDSKKNSSETSFDVFPNPTNGDYTIALKSQKKDWLISVYDSQGQLLKQMPLHSERITMSSDYLPAGDYVVTLSSQNLFLSKKMVVVKQ